MNRPCSSDSLNAIISICPVTEEQSPRNNRVFETEFQSLFDEDGCLEESGHFSEKKRRLGVNQVKALEKNFELDNKLEPERKVKLARELGLQPRQVAVWFQNRRARWKTKQLERDYGVLKANYDALKLNFDTVRRDNEALLEEIKEAKAKLFEEENSVKMADSDLIEETNQPRENPFPVESESTDLNCQSFKINNNGVESGYEISFLASDSKDGLSDESDSSAILNENSSPTAAISSPPEKLVSSSSTKMESSSSSASSLNCFPFQKSYQPQLYVKMEENNFFSEEEGCSFFSADQAPTLQWCYEDQWD